jgi:hypothetical protein
VINAHFLQVKDKVFEVLGLMSSCLSFCKDLKFIDEYLKMIKVKHMLGSMAQFVNDNKEVNWQILTVAAKFKVIDKFINVATGADGKIPRIKKKAEQFVPPKQDSLNLRHKFLYALFQTYPSFDKDLINLVLDNPGKLGYTSFLDTVQATGSKKTCI